MISACPQGARRRPRLFVWFVDTLIGLGGVTGCIDTAKLARPSGVRDAPLLGELARSA